MQGRWTEVEALIARLAEGREVIQTLTGKPNRIVSYEPGRRLVVETDTGVNPVSLAHVKACWETFEAKRRISRDDVLDPGRRSAFMMALFRLVPGVREGGTRPTYLVLEDHPAGSSEPMTQRTGQEPEAAYAHEEMADPDLQEVLAALSDPPLELRQAADSIPDRPGLYAIYCSAGTWAELGLGEPPDSRPLYVGKAEASLVTRDLRTHFSSGRTGQSTVRRSFAALLRDALDLEAVPRNPAKPERFANYGLAKHGDERLTEWMLDRLSIAVWPSKGRTPLSEVERDVLRRWLPPLNLKDVMTPWTTQLKAARRIMADEARANAGAG